MKHTLISVEELAARDPRDTLIVDCRFDLADTDRGGSLFLESHVPGAVYAHLDRDLSRPEPALGRHPLPRAEDFAERLARWGWNPARTVVAYDDASGGIAARLWWMMRLAGFEAQVLDGGFAAWRDAGAALERDARQERSAAPALAWNADAIVYVDELERLRADPRTLLLDARANDRFRGENETLDPVAGHIPGARNRPFMQNLEHGRYKSPARLAEEFGAILGTHAPGDVIHSCGSGVTACANLLAMEHAGLAGSRVFAPSWSGWVADRTRPVATGALP